MTANGGVKATDDGRLLTDAPILARSPVVVRHSSKRNVEIATPTSSRCSSSGQAFPSGLAMTKGELTTDEHDPV